MKRILLSMVVFVLTFTTSITAQAEQKIGVYNCNDVRTISNLTETEIRDRLPKKMKELAPTLYQIEHSKTPINAIFLASIIRLETGNGTSYSYNHRNNVGGIMGKSGLKTFKNKEESLTYMQSFLNRLYINQGRINV